MNNSSLNLIYKKINKVFDSKEQFLEINDTNKKKLTLPKLNLNSRQKEAIALAKNNTKNLFLILHGGVRSGKTYIALYIFLQKVLKAKEGELFLATGYNLSSLRNNIEQVFSDFGLNLGVDYTYNHLLYRYQINDKVIRLCGANNSRSFSNIRGCTASGWYANEIVLQDQEAVFECIKRVSTNKRFKIWDTNPASSHHYIYKKFIENAEQNGILALRFTTHDNKENIADDYIQEQRALLSENDQKIFLDGMWLENVHTPFYFLNVIEYDFKLLVTGFFDRIAFLDPATGTGDKSSKTALAIIFHERDYSGIDNFYFLGKTFKGLWADHLPEIASILNKLQVDNFFYENNLIGKGVIERDFEFLKFYDGNIGSIRNSAEKIARISSIIAPVEKKQLSALSFGDPDFINDVKFANLEDKKNLDAVDALESAYRLLTT